MIKITYDTDRCKGWHYCISSCPKGCVTLSEEMNTKGYRLVSFDEEACIGCGTCYTVCPDYAITIVKEG